jgi:hypothetical protein
MLFLRFLHIRLALILPALDVHFSSVNQYRYTLDPIEDHVTTLKNKQFVGSSPIPVTHEPPVFGCWPVIYSPFIQTMPSSDSNTLIIYIFLPQLDFKP